MDDLNLSRKSSNYANDMLLARFPQGDVKKMRAKMFKEDIKSAHIAGVLSCIESILFRNESEKYQSIEEIFGDLHIISVLTYNNFTKMSRGQYKPITIERFRETCGIIEEAAR